MGPHWPTHSSSRKGIWDPEMKWPAQDNWPLPLQHWRKSPWSLEKRGVKYKRITDGTIGAQSKAAKPWWNISWVFAAWLITSQKGRHCRERKTSADVSNCEWCKYWWPWAPVPTSLQGTRTKDWLEMLGCGRASWVWAGGSTDQVPYTLLHSTVNRSLNSSRPIYNFLSISIKAGNKEFKYK